MINLANHHTSCHSCTYAPTMGLSTSYRLGKPKQVLQNKKTIKINSRSKRFNSKNFFLRDFKTKSLLCWRSDIWYLNLRCGFLNLISACHLIWTVVKNNGKIAFVNHGGPQDEKAHLSLIDLLVQTQIKPKAVPRFKRGTFTLQHKLNKPDFKTSKSKKSRYLKKLSFLSNTGTGADAGLKKMPYKQQQKGGFNAGPLVELCSVLNVELTTNKSKAELTKPSRCDVELQHTKPEFNVCQSKVNVLKSRLNLITYGDETAPAKGYFSNSDATFKSQLSDLLPHSDRKNKLLMRQSDQSARFKNCKSFQLTPLDLSKPLISASNTVEEEEFKRSRERTYVPYGNKYRTKLALFGTDYQRHAYYQTHSNVKRKAIGHRAIGCVTYSQRYYGKASTFDARFPTAKGKNSRQYKQSRFQHRVFLNPSAVKPNKRIKGLKTIKDLHDINTVLLKRSKLKVPYSRRFWTKAKLPMPYCQPYWNGTNKYKQMHFVNNINSTKHFATNPFISQANVVVFSHPEKALGLVNQIRNLRIPTVGFVSGSNKLSHQTANIVDFPILGNAENVNFVTCALKNFISLLNCANARPKAIPSKLQEIKQIQNSKPTRSNITTPKVSMIPNVSMKPNVSEASMKPNISKASMKPNISEASKPPKPLKVAKAISKRMPKVVPKVASKAKPNPAPKGLKKVYQRK